MRERKSISIFGYAIWSVVPIGIAILVAMGVYGNSQIRELVESDLLNHLKETGRIESGRVQERLDTVKEFNRALAENDLIINGLIDLDGRASYLPAFFSSLKLPFSAEGAVWLLDYKGRIIASGGTDFDHPPSITLAPKRGSLRIGPDSLLVIEPVLYSGFPEGIVVLRYPATSFQKLFGSAGIGNEFYLVGEDGLVIYSTNSTLAKSGKPLPTKEIDGWVQMRNPLPSERLDAVIAASFETIAQPLKSLEAIQFNGMIVFLLVTVGLVVIAAFIVSRPLKKFADHISEIQNIGELGKRLDTRGPAEISELAGAFNTMFSKLDASLKSEQILQDELREAQKLEAVGQLAGGIAHEINTPIQYIGDNLRFLEDAQESLFRLTEECLALVKAAEDFDALQPKIRSIRSTEADVDLEYLYKEVPLSLEQSLDGVGQVARIVLAMKEFSHPGSKEMTVTDINRALENTLTISCNQWKHVAEVVTKFDKSLPATPCLPGELNQVFLNLIINAAHAIEVAADRQDMGRIVITTESRDGFTIISVEDDGAGISEDIQDKIFNPFFTTKDVGLGTGQGLPIARDIVVNKHGGRINFETTPGKGTTFTVKLPVGPDAGDGNCVTANPATPSG